MLYHATHRNNVESIYLFGLDKARSTGKAQRVWMCEEEMVLWAIKHVCERHGWNREDVRVIAVGTNGVPLRRHSVKGIFWTPESVPAHNICDAYVVSFVSIKTGAVACGDNHIDD